MVAPVYSSDLPPITADTAKGTVIRCDSTSALPTTGCLGSLTWSEPANAIAGGVPAIDSDYFILGVATSDKTFNATGLGGLGVTTGSAASLPTDGAFLFWNMFLAPNAVNTKANGGIQCIVGSSSSAYYKYYIDGDDTRLYGGWECNPVNPVVTASATEGSPTSTRQYFGMIYNVDNAVSKGNPAALGALRFGRCYIKALNGESANYATFAGVGTFNDYNDGTNGWNRLGLFQYNNGSYQWQGLLQLGDASTVVDFRDSNRNIVVANTEFVTANFNTIEVLNASSRVDWTGISIQALGTVSKGRLLITDNADINFDNCTFTDMDAFTFQALSTVLNSTFRRCGLVTVGGGVFTNCKFDSPTGAIGVTASSPANAALITNSTFTSDGTGHGLEITGTAVASMTLTNNTWTGYAASDGSTGNEAVYVNIASGTMNLVISGGTTPSVRTAGCSVTVVTSSRTIKVITMTPAGSTIGSATVHLHAIAGGPFPYDATVTITRSGTLATVSHTGHGMASNDQVEITGITDKTADNGLHTITWVSANSYSYTTTDSGSTSYTGTIKSGFVFFHGTTNGSGEISMSRSIPSNQPVTGWGRKASASPYYKEGSISGTVLSASDTTFNAVMALDE